MWIITSGLVRLRLVAIYRPIYSPNHPVTASMFLTEFAEFLESIVMSTEPLIMAGDFNIHVNVPSDNDTVRFLDLLSSMGLQQHIDFPTHVSGNTLDLLITRSSDSRLIRDVQPDAYFSDHCSVLAILNQHNCPGSY